MKYVIVGCMNTAITLGVIFVCKSLLDVNPYLSNALGYIAGLINSFIWNKNWVASNVTLKKNACFHRRSFFFIFSPR